MTSTTNSLKQIVPGSKAAYKGTTYDVGEVSDSSARLYLSGHYVITVDIKDAEPL